MFLEMKYFIYQRNKVVMVINKKDKQIINSLYEKLKLFKNEGINISKKEVEDFFILLISKN